MRYYVVSDTHGFFTETIQALKKSGFFSEKEPHKLIICGDILDRGYEAQQMVDFVLQMMKEDRIILIRGNHEDLLEDLATEDRGLPYAHHKVNGTYQSALQLTDFDRATARILHFDFANQIKETDFYKKVIPAAKNYYETEHYIFVHGWLPYKRHIDGSYEILEDWRDASEMDWKRARWVNGMEASFLDKTRKEKKTIVCGHWHTSFGHCRYEKKGTEFGNDADFTPYFGDGIIALDACTAASGFVNCVVLDD